MKSITTSILYISFLLLFVYSCAPSKKNTKMQKADTAHKGILDKGHIIPPDAEAIPVQLEKHGDVRIDNYYWMKLSDEQKLAETPDESTQKVLDYLEAENAYTGKMMDHLTAFQDTLFEEIKGRIKEDDESVPYKDNGYYYITRYEKGMEYPIYSRKKDNLDADEEIMLNVNVLAEPYEYYNVSARSVSPDNKILAYGEDTLSRRQYTIRFKNLETGEMYPDKIANTTGGIVWANDNKTVFYTRKDDALRSYKIFRHVLGEDPQNDVEVFHETDEMFSAFVYKTKSQKYIVVGSWATLTQEYQLLDADNPTGELTMFQPRVRGLEYDIAHYDDKWYIRTNKDGAVNFKIMTTPEDQTGLDNWEEMIPHRDDVFISGVDIFKNYLVVSERVAGISQIRIMPWEGEEHHIDFGESAFTAGTAYNPEFDTDIIRVNFTSMTTPNTVYDYNMKTRKLKQMKQQEVLGIFNQDDYVGKRVEVKAADGTMIPMSIVYKKDIPEGQRRPFLLYGYGSYGYSMDPYFSSVRLSLLDRGFGYAIAHIRGGQEMGRMWYENGKFLKKKNTFTDFIDCGEFLINQGYAEKGNLFAMGGSAGGLLMGAVVNMRPDLFKGIVAAVPFVDVVTTMLDESIPLTTGEYDEWGNPNDQVYYDYIKSYSPYDNVTAVDYPAMLVTTGYHDSQVQYWEPAKWVAKLRDLKTDGNPLLLHTNMGAGHGGASGRFQRYKEIAMEYAFLLDLADKAN